MNNVILLSENFERATYNLIGPMERLSFDRFIESVNEFTRSIDKLQTLLAMQAANQERLYKGLSIAYDEDTINGVQ